MWTGGWIVQSSNDSRLYRARDEILQAASFFVHLVPLHSQHIDKKTLGQSMSSQHGVSGLNTSFSQRHLSLVIHRYISIAYDAVEYFCSGWRGTPKPPSG